MSNKFLRTLFGRNALLSVLLLGYFTAATFAQEIPTFAPETNNSPLYTEYGLGMAQYQNTVYGSVMFMLYVDNVNLLSAAISVDGQSFTDQGEVSASGTFFELNCNAGNPAACTPAVAVFNGVAYIAFADHFTGGLDVVAARPGPNSVGYSYSLAYTNTAVHPTSAAAMIVSPNGANLIIRYGTSSVPGVNNGTFVTTFNGSSWSTNASGAFAPTQSAMATLNGNLYVIDKQNNSSNGVFVSQLDNNGMQVPNTVYQIPGAIVNNGFSAVTFKNSIVVVVQSNTPQHYFYVFSSNNGTTWAQNLYSNITTGPVPQIALFNQGVTEAHQSNDSTQAIFSAFASQ